jgi:hypothetical protein
LTKVAEVSVLASSARSDTFSSQLLTARQKGVEYLPWPSKM